MELKLHICDIQNLLLFIKISVSNITLFSLVSFIHLCFLDGRCTKGRCQHSPSFTTTWSEMKSTYTFSLIQCIFISVFKQKPGSEKLVQEYK